MSDTSLDSAHWLLPVFRDHHGQGLHFLLSLTQEKGKSEVDINSLLYSQKYWQNLNLAVVPHCVLHHHKHFIRQYCCPLT